MKNLTLLTTIFVVILMLGIGIQGCTQDNKQILEPQILKSPPGGGQAGTTLSATITAECFNYFDWSCVKNMEPGPYTICAGESYQIEAAITVTKGDQHMGVSGVICVTNGGAQATVDLKVGAVLESKPKAGVQFTATSYKVTGLESQHPVLNPGETYCYTYTINCVYDPNYIYRVSTDGYVTIMNHSGSIGTPKGPNEKSNSYEPCLPSNDCITLTDAVGIPVKATDPPMNDPDSWSFTVAPDYYNVCNSGDYTFTITINNVNAENEYTWNVINNAYINGVLSCSAPFELSTVGCSPPPTGCTRTIGYWKTHAGFHGRNPDVVTQYLPVYLGAIGGPKTVMVTSAYQANQILSMKVNGVVSASNGIVKLYAQLLAAKLNIANGANGDCIADIIAAADEFLAMKDYTDWAGLTKSERQYVLQLMSTLDKYNNGLLPCAPHCE